LCQADNAATEQSVEPRTFPQVGLLADGFNKVLIEPTGDGIEPAPVRGQAFEDDGAAMPSHPHLLALETAAVSKPH
jgi:hypothetical protein